MSKLKCNTQIIILIVLYCLYSCNNSNQKKVLSSHDAMNGIAVSKEADSLNHIYTDKAALSKTADSLYQKRKYLEALFIYQRLLRIDSNDSLFYFRSGYCEGMSFLYVEAIKDFKSALNHNYRKKASCYFNLSADYASIDSESMSIYYAQKCIEADSTMKPKIIELLKHNNYKW